MAVRIRSSMEADRYVRQRGGRLYVSLQPFGGFTRLTVSTKPPRSEVDFELVHGGGVELLLDRSLERPKVVEVSLHRWPWRRIRVRGLRYRPGGAATEEVTPSSTLSGTTSAEAEAGAEEEATAAEGTAAAERA